MTLDIMKELGSYCDEFLVHAVDVEGKHAELKQNLHLCWVNIKEIRSLTQGELVP